MSNGGVLAGQELVNLFTVTIFSPEALRILQSTKKIQKRDENNGEKTNKQTNKQ